MSHARRLGPALLALIVACGGGGGEAADTAGLSGPIAAAPAPVAGDTTCPATGQWALCSVFKSIERAGLNVLRDSAKQVNEAPLSIAGTEVPVARGDIRIFLYADSGSRRRDQLKLDSTLFVPPNRDPWARQRTLIPSGNLLVLMNVFTSINRERISNALLAGAPQPPSQRP